MASSVPTVVGGSYFLVEISIGVREGILIICDLDQFSVLSLSQAGFIHVSCLEEHHVQTLFSLDFCR